MLYTRKIQNEYYMAISRTTVYTTNNIPIKFIIRK